MKCDQCDNEATVHEVTITNGIKGERHLCERCAGVTGVPQGVLPIAQAIKQVVSSHARAAMKPGTCPVCGLTFTEFKQHGLLGCPDCYTAFESSLAPLLERAHEGGVAHTGKRPAHAGDAPAEPPPESAAQERIERLQRIRRELELAVKAEQYERAAKLRDELKSFGLEAGPAGAHRPGQGGERAE